MAVQLGQITNYPNIGGLLHVTLGCSIRIYGTICSTLFSKTDQLLQNDSQENTDNENGTERYFLNSISKHSIMMKKKGCLLYTHQL